MKHPAAVIKNLLFSLLIISLLPFLILAAFSNPAYDDYCYSRNTLRFGFVHTQLIQFYEWSGRYFSTVILTLSPTTFANFTGYKIVALLVILLTFTSLFCLVRATFDSKMAVIDSLMAAGVLTALFSNHMPDITEGYYWMAASVSYQFASALTLFLFTFLILSLRKSPRLTIFQLLSCFVLIFIIVGSSETSMIYLLFFLGTAAAKAFLMKTDNRWNWIALVAVALLCSAVVVLAPGNVVRSSHFPERHKLFSSLIMAFEQGTKFLVSRVLNPAFMLATILFVPIAAKLSKRSLLLKNHLYLHPLSSLGLLLTIVLLGFLPVYWATGMSYEYRTANTAYFFFLVGWFLNVVVWVAYFRERRNGVTWDPPAHFFVVGFLLMVLCLGLTNNSSSAFSDLLTNRAYYYDHAERNRRLRLEQCAKDKISPCRVDPITDLPTTITNPYYVTEISCNEWYWQLRTTTSKYR